MKLETNDDGKIVLFKRDTGEEVLFDFQIDAREALMCVNPKTGNSSYIVPEKKKKFGAPVKKEEVVETVVKDEGTEPSKGLKVGRGRPPKVKEVAEEDKKEDIINGDPGGDENMGTHFANKD